MKTVIYMMRHGAVENPGRIEYGRLPGFPLSEAGQRQAQAMAQTLKRKAPEICQIVASPMERTRQTADIVSAALGAAIRIDERLTEWDQGPWEGRTTDEFSAKSGYYAKPMVTTGMEPHAHAAERVIAAVRDLGIACAGKVSLIISHRESMASAILKLTGKDFEAIHDLDMPVASVWRLEFEDGDFLHAERTW
jgi:broad specificity phosphatase PhoE